MKFEQLPRKSVRFFNCFAPSLVVLPCGNSSSTFQYSQLDYQGQYCGLSLQALIVSIGEKVFYRSDQQRHSPSVHQQHDDQCDEHSDGHDFVQCDET